MNGTIVYKKWTHFIILELGLSVLKLDFFDHLAMFYLFILLIRMRILKKKITRAQQQNRKESKKDLVNFVFLYN